MNSPRRMSSRWKTLSRLRWAISLYTRIRHDSIADNRTPYCTPTSQRHKLKGPFTPVTPETFAIWLKQRADKKSAEAEAKEKAKATQRAAGRVNGMSGRHMFEFGGIQDEEVSFRRFGPGNDGVVWLICRDTAFLTTGGRGRGLGYPTLLGR